MNLLFRLFSIRLHAGEQVFLRGTFVAHLFAAERIVFAVTRLAFGGLGRAGCFVIPGVTPVLKGV